MRGVCVQAKVPRHHLHRRSRSRRSGKGQTLQGFHCFEQIKAVGIANFALQVKVKVDAGLLQVKSVLDAVNILLSDKHAPFVCLIAVDSRIAVKSVEQKMTPELLQSNINGHEYLKKVINLPFCLPPVSSETVITF